VPTAPRLEETTAKGFDRVFAFVRERFLAGAVRPGDRLPPERELCLRLGVSRPALREALRALAMLGVVEIHHGVGTIVRRPDTDVLREVLDFALAQRPDLAEDVMQARIAIECQAARLACERATAADLERLRAALDRVEATMDDADEGGDADHAFHLALVQAGHSETLLSLYRAMEDLLRRSHRERRDIVRRSAAMRADVLEDHARVLQALATGDALRTDAALRRHFAIGDEQRRSAALAGLMPTETSS
jgi:DNA-binding FadR family transcriptional regulator